MEHQQLSPATDPHIQKKSKMSHLMFFKMNMIS